MKRLLDDSPVLRGPLHGVPLILAVTLLITHPPPASAQISVDHLVLGSAALDLSGGTRNVRGTLGQPAIGTVNSGLQVGRIGYWHLLSEGSVIGVEDPPTLPRTFRLLQNHPNPFRAQTAIRFDLAEPRQVTLRIFDIRGRVVGTLLDERMPPGEYTLLFHPTHLAGGIYWLRLQAGSFVQNRKLIRIP